jgi:hypothetical protein
MRIGVFSILILFLLNCKKENKTVTDQKDSVENSKVVKKNSLKNPAINNEEIFNFQTELCENRGYFDVNKFTQKEIKDTYTLWFKLTGTVLLDTPSVFRLNDLEKVRQNKDEILAKLDKDFAEKKSLIENLTIVNIPYWQNVKKGVYQDLLQEYQKRKTEILAFSDPSILLHYKSSEACNRFVKTLNSDDATMIEEWRKLRVEMSKRNGDPQRIMDEFEEHLNSDDKKEYATIDLITFGWGNCANENTSSIEHDEKMNNEFNALFIKIDSECDEP